jgi:hypothetical protein
MQVFQTAGVPPRRGSTMRANIGWTRKRRAELTNKVQAKKTAKALPPRRRPAGGRAQRFIEAIRERSANYYFAGSWRDSPG